MVEYVHDSTDEIGKDLRKESEGAQLVFFEGEKYPLNFIELISDKRLIDECVDGKLTILR